MQPFKYRWRAPQIGCDFVTEYSNKNPYLSNINVNYVLNGEGSLKETRHIVFDLGDSGLEYKAGDALGVFPTCPPDLVDLTIERLGSVSYTHLTLPTTPYV